ncbi:MAG: Crp/Fnr family transcriptional regulator [Candidatus Bipolaricaulota bacterium]|nr:Crp/Fnr family transcriptional regulator [Candidatus Bipolaricaulota bacterium]
MTIDETVISTCSTKEPDCLLSDVKVQEVLSDNPSARFLDYEKGENVFKEGKPIVGFYLICEGLVKEVSCPSIGNRITLKVFEAGDVLITDAFFFDEERYHTMAEALTEVETLFIERSVFPELMRVAGEKIGMKLAQNMRYLRKNLEFSSFPVLKNIAYWLAKLLPDSSNRFTVSNKELAEIVGCSHVTVSKKLGRLADDDLIEKEGKEITVLDKVGLREKAAGTSFG